MKTMKCLRYLFWRLVPAGCSVLFSCTEVPDLMGPLQARSALTRYSIEKLEEGPGGPISCQIVENVGEELDRAPAIWALIPGEAQERLHAGIERARSEMAAKDWQPEDEPDPIKTDPDIGRDVREELSDIQDRNTAAAKGLTEVSADTAICVTELSERALPHTVQAYLEDGGEDVHCYLQCLRQASTAAFAQCVARPRAFMGPQEDALANLSGFLAEYCASPQELCVH